MDNRENDLDILILQNGAIVMYHNTILLDEDIEWFDNNSYEILDIDVQHWNAENFHDKIKRSFNFPDYYGKNMNALEECLDELINRKFRGLVLILRNIDDFVCLDKDLAVGLLNIIARTSRRWLLSGQFLIGVLQSNDPDLNFDKVGGTKPFWNGNEWFDEERRNKIIPPKYNGPPPELL